MQRIARLSLLTGLLLLGATSMTLWATQSIAQNADSTSSLLHPASFFKVTTKSRRARNVPYLAAAAPVVEKKEPSIRPVIAQDDIEERHQKIAEEMLRQLPEKCQSSLQNFYVRYDNPKQRGLAGKNTVIVSGNVPDDEFRALLAHEFGHLMDLGCMKGTAKSGDSAFKDGGEVLFNDDPSVAFYSISWKNEKTKKVGATAQDFVSGYAQWDPFEDLAETVAAYELHREALMDLAARNAAIAAKVQWIETYLFPKHTGDHSESSFVWEKKHPWDITKLPYHWTASLD